MTEREFVFASPVYLSLLFVSMASSLGVFFGFDLFYVVAVALCAQIVWLATTFFHLTIINRKNTDYSDNLSIPHYF